MSKVLRWYGSSDDLFGYEIGTTGCGEDHDCGTGSLMAFTVVSGDEGLRITGQYAPLSGGTWVVGVTLLAENRPLPEWPMQWETADNDYSPMLVMVVPDDAVITDLLRSKEDTNEH